MNARRDCPTVFLVSGVIKLRRLFGLVKTRAARGLLFVLIWFIVIAVFILEASPSATQAAVNSWLFESGDSYTLGDSSQLEIAGNSARLKVRNYSSDDNTAALYHLDESGGTSAADSSANSNTGTVTAESWGAGKLNNALTLNGNTSRISVPNSASLGLSQDNTIEAWTKFSSQFSATSHSYPQGIVNKGDYQLYYDNATGKITYELADSSASTWTQEAGSDIKGSWDLNGKAYVYSTAAIGTDVYVGLGEAVGDAEVWKWNGATWSMIGGDGINGSWQDQMYEGVLSMATDGTNLFIGLGVTAGEADVWRWNGTAWAQIGGDGLNTSWAVNTYEVVWSMVYSGSTLYAGLGTTNSDAEVWSWNGTSWTQIGGDSLNSGWGAGYNTVRSMTAVGANLYAGLGDEAGEAEVWEWSGASWAKVGGDAVGRGGAGASWANTTYEIVGSLAAVGATLYAGIGTTANDAEVWRFDDPGWTQVGGDSLNFGWTANYETVRSLAGSATTLYAGLGDGSGDGELWSWDGASWTKIGGDGVNSSFPVTGGGTSLMVNSLLVLGTTLYAGTVSNADSGDLWRWSDSTWTLLGGDYYNNSWGYQSIDGVISSATMGSKMYVGTFSGAGDAQVWEYDGSSWTRIAGQGLNNGWAFNSIEEVRSLAGYKGALYAGTGTTAGDGDVWKWNGTSWSQVGGDGTGWGAGYEIVYTLAVTSDKLYAGLGSTAGEAEVWEYNGSTWVKVGGDGANSSWPSGGNFEIVRSLAASGSTLYAGLGTTAGDAEVWAYSGGSWAQIGGDGINSSWAIATYEVVDSLAAYDGYLYAGLGLSGGDAEVWRFNGTSWSQVGGDSINSSWDVSFEIVYAMAVYNGDLYASLGNSADDAEVWRFNGTSWTKVGGDGINGSWLANTPPRESAYAVIAYAGKLYVGTGDGGSEASVWSYGNNAVLRSTTVGQDTNWHHIAATYDGATMKIYIDGVLDNSAAKAVSLPQSGKALLIGSTYGKKCSGSSQGFFAGSLDEVRISNIARSSFITSTYAADGQTVTLTAPVLTSQVKSWDGFSASETPNGGSINYRISSDNGTTWKYWDGDSWETSASIANANPASTINERIPAIGPNSGGFKWQAILDGDGSQQVTLNSLTLTYTPDSLKPANPDTLTALNAADGSTSLTSGSWYNYPAPYFNWSGADDAGGAGVAGYYVYFGPSDSANPFTAGAYQTGATYTASSLSSGSTYYLRLKTKDAAGNISDDVWPAFTYKFDSTAPTAIEYVNVSPVGCSTTTNFTFSWPVSSDDNSGIAGYEYKKGTTGSTNQTTQTTLTATPYQDGDNIIYVRSKDNANNTSSWQTGVYCSTGVASIIDGPAAETGPSSITVNWVSSKKTTGFVEIRDGNIYREPQGHRDFKLTHEVQLGGLKAEKQYEYRVIWQDETKNDGESDWYQTTTAVAPAIKNLEANILSPSSANVSWVTTYNSEDTIEYGIGNYDQAIKMDGVGTQFSKELTGLQAGSNYQIRVRAVSEDGTEFFGAKDLETPPVPKVSNLRFEPIKDFSAPAVKVTWETNIEASSAVFYRAKTEGGAGGYKELSSTDKKKDHEITIENLSDNTTYELYAKGSDQYGNETTSDINTFMTDYDTRPPKIDSIVIESSNVGTSSQDKAQIVVSWKTDEPATSLVEYGEGLGATDYTRKTTEDKTLSTHHLVIISELEPQTPYHLRVASSDKANNATSSKDNSVIPGEVQKSILSIVLDVLNRTFGWMTRFI